MFLGAFILMFFVGTPLIDWLRHKHWRKDQPEAETWTVREDTPETHQAKQGTPSMGGIGLIGSACLTFIALVSTGAILGLLTRSVRGVTGGPTWLQLLGGVLLPPLTVLAFTGLGFTDDWSKASGRGGLSARAKFVAQVGLALGFVGAFALLTFYQSYLGVRFVYPALFAGGAAFLPVLLGIIAMLIVTTSNAVNLTDGIDGLAAGLAVQVGLALWIGGTFVAPFEVSYFSNMLWMALAGASLGFLVYNHYPARVFMGDTGSLALGAALGMGAVLAHATFLLPFIGFMYFVEMFSVMLQVSYFKWTKRKTGEGKRIFRRAPLHHHYELGGWSEWRVVMVFWAINLLTTCVGLYLWAMNFLPHWP